MYFTWLCTFPILSLYMSIPLLSLHFPFYHIRLSEMTITGSCLYVHDRLLILSSCPVSEDVFHFLFIHSQYFMYYDYCFPYTSSFLSSPDFSFIMSVTLIHFLCPFVRFMDVPVICIVHTCFLSLFPLLFSVFFWPCSSYFILPFSVLSVFLLLCLHPQLLTFL